MINKAILLGHVGSAPEIRVVGENSVAEFTFATSQKWKDKQGEKKEQTEWHNIVAWRGLAKLAEGWIHKGAKLYIEGAINYQTWDKPDGTKGYKTVIVANDIKTLDKKQADSQPSPTPSGSDDLPF